MKAVQAAIKSYDEVFAIVPKMAAMLTPSKL